MRFIWAIIIILLVFSFSGITFAFEESYIHGKVIDKYTKEPVPAFIIPEGSGGFTANEDGSFKFRASEHISKIIVYFIGYKKKEITVKKGEFLLIELEPEPLEIHEITVTADSSVSEGGTKKTLTLTKLDVYRTPGTAADPVYSAQILPGVNSIPDAASLIIRGGAPDEVSYYLDGIEIEHPYQSESLREGYFSIFDNQIIKNFSVSTAGFSSKFGGALSGIVNIQTNDLVYKREGAIGLSTIGLVNSMNLPIGEKGSFIGCFNLTHSYLMTKINGEEGYNFKSGEAIGKFVFKISELTKIQFLSLAQGYKFFDEVENLTAKTRQSILGFTLSSVLSQKLFFKVILSINDYKGAYSIPSLFNKEINDFILQGKADLTWDMGTHLIETGFDVRRKSENFICCPIDSAVRGIRYTFYINDKFRINDKLFANIGIRAACLNLNNYKVYFDPRLSLAFLISAEQIIRFSTGIYNQFGDYFYIKDFPSLKPKKAIHFSLSYDILKKEDTLRFTVYNKEYRNLFLFEKDRITNNGYGYARGFEIFIKRNKKYYDLLFVYNFLRSKRKEEMTDFLARSPYEIDHSFTAIFTIKFKGSSLSIRYSFAKGLPYTPLIGREWNEKEEEWEPVWGEAYSRRYPSFKRVDISLNRAFTLGERMFIFFAGVMNLFNHKNILEYSYSDDFSQQKTIGSIFSRTFYFGFEIFL